MRIEVVGFPGSVNIEASEYKGDMDQFIQKILLKKMPSITNDFYNKTLYHSKFTFFYKIFRSVLIPQH